MKDATTELLIAVVPKPEALIDGAQLGSSAHAVQSQEAAPVLPCQLARMVKKRMGNIQSLLTRVEGKLVNERG